MPDVELSNQKRTLLPSEFCCSSEPPSKDKIKRKYGKNTWILLEKYKATEDEGDGGYELMLMHLDPSPRV